MYSQPPSLRSRPVCHVPTLKGSDVLPFLRILMTTTRVNLLSNCKIHWNNYIAYIFFLKLIFVSLSCTCWGHHVRTVITFTQFQCRNQPSKRQSQKYWSSNVVDLHRIYQKKLNKSSIFVYLRWTIIKK